MFRETDWTNLFRDCNTDEKIKVIMEIICKAVNENCEKFKQTRGKTRKIIPRDSRILLRNKKKVKEKLRSRNISSERKKDIEKTITDIDVKLLTSHRN